MDNLITLIPGARHQDSWLPSTQLYANESQTSTLSQRLPKNTQTPYVLNFLTTKSEITITGSIGLRPANLHLSS